MAKPRHSAEQLALLGAIVVHDVSVDLGDYEFPDTKKFQFLQRKSGFDRSQTRSVESRDSTDFLFSKAIEYNSKSS